jgi:hypothetical protein
VSSAGARRTRKITGIRLSTFNVADLGWRERRAPLVHLGDDGCGGHSRGEDRACGITATKGTGVSSPSFGGIGRQARTVAGEEMWPLTATSSLR